MLTISSPESVAAELRPLLLRVNRRLRREALPTGTTVGQISLLVIIRERPGIGVRELAELRADVGAGHVGHVDRLERAGLVARSPVERRPPPGRARADRRGPSACSARRDRTARPGSRAAPPADRRAAGRDRGRARAARRAAATSGARDGGTSPRQPPHLRQPRRHRNYRLFFAGQVVSVSGTWMQNIAAAWLVLELTHSPVAVGVLALCQFLPFTRVRPVRRACWSTVSTRGGR